MNFSELISVKGENQITYSDLLDTEEWKSCREKVLRKDGYYCTKCGLSESVFDGAKHISFDKTKFIKTQFNGETITADFPIETENKIILHVHHKFYVLGRLPWEYTLDELTTLCHSCHWELHQNERVKVYKETFEGIEELTITPCDRCNSAGIFPEYSHVQGGVCFKCNGARFNELLNKPQMLWFVHRER